jgi:hypothetical protein
MADLAELAELSRYGRLGRLGWIDWLGGIGREEMPKEVNHKGHEKTRKRIGSKPRKTRKGLAVHVGYSFGFYFFARCFFVYFAGILVSNFEEPRL